MSISNGLSKTSSLHTVTQGMGSKPDKTMNLMEVEVENTEDLFTSKCENCYLQSQKYLLQLFHNYLAMKLSDGLDIWFPYQFVHFPLHWNPPFAIAKGGYSIWKREVKGLWSYIPLWLIIFNAFFYIKVVNFVRQTICLTLKSTSRQKNICATSEEVIKLVALESTKILPSPIIFFQNLNQTKEISKA